MLKKILFAGGWICSVLLGCKKSSGPEADHIVTAIGAAPNTLDPRFASDATGMRISGLIFSSLVRVGPRLTVVGDAAESWNYKNLVYTFRLREGLRFSNGRAVEPEDVEFSFAQYMSPENSFRATLAAIEKAEASWEDKDKKRVQVRLHLKEYAAPLLSDLTPVKILPRDLVVAADKDFGKNPIGSGSFRLLRQSANEIVLEAVAGHAWAEPKIGKLTFKVIQDHNTMYLKTLKGDLDVTQAEIPLNKVADLEKNENFIVHKYPGMNITYLIFNLKDPELKNLETRRAFALALNRREIIDYKLAGLATPATSILSPGNPFFHEGLKYPDHDLAAAKALVKKRGLEGKSFTLKLSNDPEVVEIGKVLAHQFNAVGLDVKIQSYEWGTFYRDVQSGNFQIASMRWVGAIDPDIYRVAFHSSQFPPGKNRGFYANKKIDRWLEEGVRIENPERRVAHYRKTQELIAADLPTVPLWYRTQVAVVHKRVQNYNPPMNGDFSPFIHVFKKTSTAEGK